jgi:branched-chain amino acid transport system permease protein
MKQVTQKNLFRKHAALPIGAIIVIFFVLLPFFKVPREWILYLFLFFFYLAIANMWNLLAGYCGLVSLCQPAFMGLAGYTLVVFTWNGMPFYYGIIVGGVIAALFALVISIPVFRLKGIFFAIGTLLIPEIFRIVFLIWRPIGKRGYGGGAGYMIKGISHLSSAEIYWLALLVGLGSFFMVRAILKSKLGLGLAAIRENDVSASSSGVNVFRLKLYIFVLAAFVTGISGAIFYVKQGFIQPATSFSINWTVLLMVATVIGGLGTITGPIVGTIVVIIFQFVLARYQDLSLLIQGIILVGILLVMPRGIVGSFKIKGTAQPLFKVIHMRQGAKQMTDD